MNVYRRELKLDCLSSHGLFRMSSGSEFFRLYTLLNDAFRLYNETDSALLPKEKEKNLLILLSQVCREVKAWTTDPRHCFNSNDLLSSTVVHNALLPEVSPFKLSAFLQMETHPTVDLALLRSLAKFASTEPPISFAHLLDDLGVHATLNDKYCWGWDSLCEEGHNFFVDVILILVVFLTVESQYVQHIAGNILLAISSFLAKSGGKWEEFLRLLWATLEAAILKIHSSMSISLSAQSNALADERLTCHSFDMTDEATRNSELDPNTAVFFSMLQPRLLNANWFTVIGLLRVLRGILKSLKQEFGEPLQVYVHSCTSLLNIPWDLLNEILVGHNGGAWTSFEDISACRNISSQEMRDTFLGTLLQFFCSLMDKNVVEEVAGDSFDELPFLSKITSLIPKLLCWCFSKRFDYKGKCNFQYLRHKILILMIRLSFHINQQCSTLVLWLQLLREYFGDLLYQPISEHHGGLDDCLQGSPFLTSMVDGEKIYNSSAWHLRRQAIFLLFKCSLNLISLDGENCRKCTCATANSMLSCELEVSRKNCCAKGLSELSEWLHRHLPADKFVGYSTYSKVYSSLALSFLQLYMDEDDLLFEMLLQLLSSPLTSETEVYKERSKVFEEVKGDMLLHLSSIFNPIHLFHLFLAELHYDHLVLLDYLISKDMGVRCVQYLLRCLHLVCRSWNIFVEFSASGSEISESLSKKRKVCMDGQGCHGKAEPSSSTIERIGSSKALGRRKKRKHNSGSMPKTDRQNSFENAKECLLSLKKSVENLHQKHLFPYNPTALLRSFRRFQECCELEEKQYFERTDSS